MRDRPIVITAPDAGRLRSLFAARASVERDQDHLQDLAVELERALVLAREEAPRDVVTMHSRVYVRDLASGARRDWVLVFPGEADVSQRRISVLAPLGTALLGYREGDEVEWVMPGGLRRLRIEKVEQPSETASAEANPQLAVAMS
jgi:regulator of nucleoside diphosphate kinase